MSRRVRFLSTGISPNERIVYRACLIVRLKRRSCRWAHATF
jgi:hypothetical protein